MATLQEIRQQYPQYNDMPDGILADKLYQAHYSDMPREQFNTKIGLNPASTSNEAQPDTSLGNQLGLTARYGIEGAMALPNMLGNAANSAINLASTGINKVAGTSIPMLGMPSQLTSDLLTSAGLPQPQGSQQRIVGDISRGIAGAGTGVAAAQAANLTQLAARPIMQMLSAGSGSGTSSIAKENGVGPIGQTVAGLAGALAVPAVQFGAQYVGNNIKSSLQPFTQGGRNQIVGNMLNEFSTDPRQAVGNLQDAPQYIPGSIPMTGDASKDYGLLQLQKGVQNQAPAEFADRISSNNAARNIILNGMAGTPGDIALAEMDRNAVTAPMREDAFANSKDADLSPLNNKIREIMESPAGKREIVQKAMQWLQSRLNGETVPGIPEQNIQSSILDDLGAPISKKIPAQAPIGADPERLYSVRQDIGDLLSGKLQGEQANLRLASGQLIQARNALDDAIETGAPGFKDYLSKYRELSTPVNQMNILQDIKSRAMLAAPDVKTGFDFISQPKWSQAVQNPANREELMKVLSPQQMRNLDLITADLDRGAATSSTAIKSIGSDTFQNMSTANMIGAFLGKKANNPFMQTITRPLGWLYKLPEAAVKKTLTDAMLDPSMAARLMQKATPTNVQSISVNLMQKAILSGYGDLLGATEVQQPQQLRLPASQRQIAGSR